MSLFREPDAGNLPVRFDEREQETEPSQTGLRWRGESQVDLFHRETTVTAPVLDSTPDYTHHAAASTEALTVLDSLPEGLSTGRKVANPP